MKKIKIIAAIFIVAPLTLHAQDSIMQKYNELSQTLFPIFKSVKYLDVEKSLNDNEDTFKGTSLEAFFYQASASFYTRMGKQTKGKQYQWLSHNKNYKEYHNINNSLQDHKAILKDSKSHQIVMINENHAFPEHRVFTTSLLDSLYNQGYTYLALEDLSDMDITLNNRKYPLQTDGLHINETMFGEMVRRALEIGYTLVPYDNNDAWDIRERDSLGSLELKKVFKKDPKARMLIHCGFGHIDRNAKTLGHFIQSELEIRPLTISQTSRIPVRSNQISEPKIIENPTNDKLFSFQPDFQVIHPYYDNIIERPEYLFKNNRIKIREDLTGYDFKDTVLLEVFSINEPYYAVPMDRIVIEPNTKFIDISVSNKSYKLIFKNAAGEIIKNILRNN